jgi:hypothetical protein
MYQTKDRETLKEHCDRIGIELELYKDIILAQYKTLEAYKEHITELEQIAQDLGDWD